MTDNQTPSDTVDVTNLVEKMRESFVTWAVDYAFIMETATPGLSWVSAPIISTLNKALLRYFMNMLTKTTVMSAFFLNTAITKSVQSKDYLAAIQTRMDLPSTCTDEEYANAERNEIEAFRHLVLLTDA